MAKYKPPFYPEDVIYDITVADIIEVAENLGMAKSKVTDTVISKVQARLDSALENWSEVVEDELNALGIGR
jgi:hypothetical protein